MLRMTVLTNLQLRGYQVETSAQGCFRTGRLIAELSCEEMLLSIVPSCTMAFVIMLGEQRAASFCDNSPHLLCRPHATIPTRYNVDTVPDLTIRPTAKFIMVRLIIAGLVFLAIEILCFTMWRDVTWLSWLPWAVPLVFVPVLWRALQRQLTTVTIVGERLRYESGLLSKSTRTIQLPKVQDVRVDQRLSQRLFGVGNLSIETAGEASRLTIPDVDNPQALADTILDHSQRGQEQHPGV
jgi:membrane protein YdbS with pleckstrin-like domain